MLISLALALAAEAAAYAPAPPPPPIYRDGPVAAPPPPPPPPPKRWPKSAPARQIAGTIGPDDYPAAAVAAGAEGSVTIRIAVLKDGRVGDCVAAISSGNADLDAASCRLARERFRFRPATDRKGRPISSLATRRIVWTQPGPPPAPAPPGVTVRARPVETPKLVLADYPEEAKRLRVGGDVRMLLVVGADGRPKKCDIAVSSGQPSLDRASCAIALERIRYEPARDASGRAVEDADYYEIEWRFIRSPAPPAPSTSPPPDSR